MTIIAYARVVVPSPPRCETNRKVAAYEQKAQRYVYNALRFAQKALRYGKNVAGFARKPPRNFVPRAPERCSKAAGMFVPGRGTAVEYYAYSKTPQVMETRRHKADARHRVLAVPP